MLNNPLKSYQSLSFDEEVNLQSQQPLLTSLWEFILRTKSMPENFNLNRFFETIHTRLKNPEWEIRQNALRVLVDFIPLIPSEQVDVQVSKIFLDLVNNLGHVGPAVRKGAMDVLRVYLNSSQKPNAVTRDLVERGIEKYQENKINTSVVLGVIQCLPYIINKKLNDTTIFYIIHKLLDNIVKVLHQETVLRALVRIRDLIGKPKFDAALSTHDTYNSKMDFEMLCEIYDLHSTGSGFDNKIRNYDDTVILETEIHLQSGPAITMKIHEENNQDYHMSVPNDNATGVNNRTFKVLPETVIEDIDFEALRRTPRRVHFGGEIVKLRTPDSDSNLEDNDATISIISEDGDKPVIEIKYIENETKTTTRTTKSLIPIPIKQHTQSEPNSPTKHNLINSKNYRSSPNLSKKFSPVWGKSRIPRRFHQEVRKSVETKIQINIKDNDNLLKLPKQQIGNHKEDKSEKHQIEDKSEKHQKEYAIPKEEKAETNKKPSDTKKKINKPKTMQKPFNRDLLRSPIPRHNEIQVLHNLTSRSPSPRRLDEDISKTEIGKTQNETSDVKTLFDEEAPKSLEDKSLEDKSLEDKSLEDKFLEDKSFAFEIYTSAEENTLEKENAIKTQPEPVINSNIEPKKKEKENPKEEKQNRVLDENIVADLENMADTRARQRGLQELLRVIQTPTVLQSLQARLPSLLHLLFASEQNQVLQSVAEQILTIIFENMDEEVLEDRMQQISINLAKLGSPTGVRLALTLMKKISPKILVDHLLDASILNAKSSKIREGALLIVMTVCRIFPSTDLDIVRTLKSVISILSDKKRKVRQAALETLATLAQVAGNTQVLKVANEVVEESNDLSERQQILKVVRTRLSRKQLPTVNMNGFIRYSMPYGDPEIEWLSRGCSSSSSSSTPPSPKLDNTRTIIQDANNNIKRTNSALEVVQESFVPMATTSKRFVQIQSSSENDIKSKSFASLNNETTRINYWKSNTKRQYSGQDDSDWSEPEEEQPQHGHNTQIWAVDSNTFTNDTQNHPQTSGLRQVYMVNTKTSKSISTNTDFDDFQEAPRRNGSVRGRSFSPPKGRIYSDDTKSRWAPKHFPREHIQKSFSSEQLLAERFRKENTFSSTSSSSSSSTRLPNWQSRSGIPVPIYPHQKQKLRIRRSNSRNFNGPIKTTIDYYNTNRGEEKVKNPSVHSTPEKFVVQSGSSRRPSPLQRPPHPFSSGSESSGYFTPPPENIVPEQDFDVVNNTTTNNRFVRVASSLKVNEDPSDFNDDDDEEEHLDTTDHIPSESPVEENLPTRSIGSLNSLNNYIERTLTRNDTTNSLQEISKLRFGEEEQPKTMSAQVMITTTIHPTTTTIRKNVNSAPTLLNDSIREFSPPPAIDRAVTSKPHQLESDSLEEETEAPQLISFTTSPEKKVLIAKATLRRKPSSSTSKLLSNSSNNKCCHDSSYNSDRPFTKPREALYDISAQLESTEWEVTMKGLQGLSRLIRFHKEIVENHMHAICVLLGKHVRNLRSQVARNACLVTSQLFQITNKRPLEMELDEIAAPLLHRTADTNKFLRSDANNALDEMCNNLSLPKVVSLITFRGTQHQNAVVRCTGVRLLCNIVQRLGAEKVFQLPRDTKDKILLAGANGLMEGSLETRQHAKRLLATLSTHNQFQRAITEAVPSKVLRHINKTLQLLLK